MKCSVSELSCLGGERLSLRTGQAPYTYTGLCQKIRDSESRIVLSEAKNAARKIRLSFYPALAPVGKPGRFSCSLQANFSYALTTQSVKLPTATPSYSTTENATAITSPSTSATTSTSTPSTPETTTEFPYRAPSAVECGHKGYRIAWIAHGTVAQESEYPWMAALHTRGNILQ